MTEQNTEITNESNEEREVATQEKEEIEPEPKLNWAKQHAEDIAKREAAEKQKK